MGENGIINKAQIAKEKTNKAQEDEKDNLANLESEIDNYIISNTREQITVDKAQYEQLLADVEYLKNNSGRGVTKEVLYEGTQASTGKITLAKSINNFDAVCVIGRLNSSEPQQDNNIFIFKEDYYINANTGFIINNTTANTNRRIIFGFMSENELQIGTIENMKLVKVYGINF